MALAAVQPAAPATLSPAAERRLQTYVAAGYDPLTAPVDWYRQRPIVGAPRVWPAAPPTPTDPRVREALAWAEAQGSTALIVTRGDRLLVEHYWHGDRRDTRFNAQSMAKTVAALMLGIAIDRGEIGALDDPIGTYLNEWRGDARGRITLRHLLQMTSGLGQVDAGFGMKLVPENPAIEAYFGDDYLRPALALPLKDPPGTRFDYNNDNVKLIAAIIERCGKRPYAQLLSERLWQPLELADASTAVDARGFASASSHLFARPLDWAVLGRLFLQRGRYGSRQIVSAGWIEEMIAPGPVNTGYGLLTWVGDQQVGGTPLPPVLTPWQSERFADPGTILLNGFGGQRVWILPASGLVIVRAGRSWPSAWDDSKLPNLLAQALAMDGSR